MLRRQPAASWSLWAGPGVTAEHIEDGGADTRHDILGQLVAVAFIGSLPGRVHPVIQTTLAMHSHLLQGQLNLTTKSVDSENIGQTLKTTNILVN